MSKNLGSGLSTALYKLLHLLNWSKHAMVFFVSSSSVLSAGVCMCVFTLSKTILQISKKCGSAEALHMEYSREGLGTIGLMATLLTYWPVYIYCTYVLSYESHGKNAQIRDNFVYAWQN